jgi:hypothetical protein
MAAQSVPVDHDVAVLAELSSALSALTAIHAIELVVDL